MSKLSIYKLTGTGYERGWWTNCHCRYRAFKGARNTKKSYDLNGLEVLDKIITDKRRNVIILRNTMTSNRYSTFTTMKMLINSPDPNRPEISMRRFFSINESEMIITYKPTGQVIMFRGFDDPQKLQSIRVPVGYLTDAYFEEAFEMYDYEKWRKFDGSIRGKMPDGLFMQITFCFNSWSKEHWLYEHFFKGRMEDDFDYLMTHDYQDWCDPDLIIDYGKGLYLHTSTYKINEFRDKEIYDAVMKRMYEVAPEIFKVEGLGMWGVSGDRTYPEFNDSLVVSQQEIANNDYCCYAIGIDTGLSNGEGKIVPGKEIRLRSATTMQMCAITNDMNTLVAVDEFFHSNGNGKEMTEPQLMEKIISTIKFWRVKYNMNPVLMKGTILVYVDSADKGFRQGLEIEARKQGLFNVMFIGSTKIRIEQRVIFSREIMALGNVVFSSACENLLREIRNSRKGEKGQMREDFDDHALNAWEYGWQPIIGHLTAWSTFKKEGM